MTEPHPITRPDHETPNFIFRGYSSSDLPLIMSDWRLSNRSSPFSRNIPTDLYNTNSRQLMTNILNHQGTHALLAVNPDDTEQVFAWVVFSYYNSDILIVHYAYTKDSCRRLGIMKALITSTLRQPITDTIIICTHTGNEKVYKRIASTHPIAYNPYILANYA